MRTMSVLCLVMHGLTVSGGGMFIISPLILARSLSHSHTHTHTHTHTVQSISPVDCVP